MGGQQRKGLLRHRDRAEPLRKNQREPHLLRSGDRHPQIVSKQSPEILIMNPPDDQTGHADVFRLRHRLRGQKRPADDNLSLHIGLHMRRSQGFVRLSNGNRQDTGSLPADAEDPLNQTALRLDRDPLTRMHFYDRPVHIGQQFEYARRLTEQHLPCDRRKRFHRPGDRRLDFCFKPFNQRLILGQNVILPDRLALFLDQIFFDFIRRDAQLIRQIQRIDLARQLGSGHRLIGLHEITDRDQDRAGQRQLPPPPHDRLLSDCESRCI